jgi:hypothetical protein
MSILFFDFSINAINVNIARIIKINPITEKNKKYWQCSLVKGPNNFSKSII